MCAVGLDSESQPEDGDANRFPDPVEDPELDRLIEAADCEACRVMSGLPPEDDGDEM